MAAGPIEFWSNASDAFPLTDREPEDASETFKRGTPVCKDGSGNIIAWSSTQLILGIAGEDGHNLAVAATAENPSLATPEEMASATVANTSAPPKDGLVQVLYVNGQNRWSVKLKGAVTYTDALALPGTRYELEDGGNGYWQIDTVDTGSTADHAVQIMGPHPGDATRAIVMFDDAVRAIV